MRQRDDSNSDETKRERSRMRTPNGTSLSFCDCKRTLKINKMLARCVDVTKKVTSNVTERGNYDIPLRSIRERERGGGGIIC